MSAAPTEALTDRVGVFVCLFASYSSSYFIFKRRGFELSETKRL